MITTLPSQHPGNDEREAICNRFLPQALTERLTAKPLLVAKEGFFDTSPISNRDSSDHLSVTSQHER